MNRVAEMFEAFLIPQGEAMEPESACRPARPTAPAMLASRRVAWRSVERLAVPSPIPAPIDRGFEEPERWDGLS